MTVESKIIAITGTAETGDLIDCPHCDSTHALTIHPGYLPQMTCPAGGIVGVVIPDNPAEVSGIVQPVNMTE